jgi:hypothetical protein
MLPSRYSEDEAGRLRSAEASLPEGERAAVRLALAGHERSRRQLREGARLHAGLAAPVAMLPFLFGPELGAPEMESLADRLDEAIA